MTHDAVRIREAAQVLREARAARRPVARISETRGISRQEDAYAVAAVNTAHRIADGARVVGMKVGLTSKAVQAQLGVDQPDFGVLLDDMELVDGAVVPMDRLIQPKIEAEIAFVVGRDLGRAPPSYAELVGSLAYALPALEIVDSAIRDWRITLVDTIADNASCGLYVLGLQPVALGQLDLAAVAMQLDRNGRTESSGSGAACLGHPLRAAFWLARTMAARDQWLRAGQVILSGALGPMVPLAAGDEIEARLGPLGSVRCRASTDGAAS